MELKDFIVKFAEQFFDTDESEFAADTEYKTLEEWSSLQTLAIIAMIDAEYGVVIDGTNIRDTETIEDLFNLVKSLKK